MIQGICSSISPSGLIIVPFIHISLYLPCAPLRYARSGSSTVADLLHGTVLANMNVQPVRLVVHGHHGIGLDDAVLLGEVLLCECLLIYCQHWHSTLALTRSVQCCLLALIKALLDQVVLDVVQDWQEQGKG